MTGSAVGGGDLMAAPSGGTPAELSGMGGVGANVLRTEPSTAAAVGGGDLISFDERDTRASRRPGGSGGGS